MSHTTTMRAQTKHIVIERTVQYFLMILGMDCSTHLLPKQQEVKPKAAGQGELLPQKN